MKPFLCLLLMVLVSGLPARAQRPPNPSGPYTSGSFQSGPYPPRM